jgi:hypothetical protein
MTVWETGKAIIIITAENLKFRPIFQSRAFFMVRLPVGYFCIEQCLRIGGSTTFSTVQKPSPPWYVLSVTDVGYGHRVQV